LSKISFVAFHTNGRLILTGGLDGEARVWQAQKSPYRFSMQHTGRVRTLAFSPDGKKIVTGSADNRADIWDAVTGEHLHLLPHDSSVFVAEFSPDGKTVLTADLLGPEARLWNVETGQPFPFRLSLGAGKGIGIRTAAFSPDGGTIATGGQDGNIRLWNARTGQPLGVPLPHRGDVVAVVFYQEGKVIAAASQGGLVRRWHADTGTPIPPDHWHEATAAVLKAAFSSDGRFALTGCNNGSIQFWDRTAAVPIFRGEHQGMIRSVALSSDGKMALTCGADHLAHFWDTTTGCLLGKLPHQKARSAIWSPDDRLILIAGDDGCAQLWHTATRKRWGPPLQHADPLCGAVFSPHGHWVLTGSSDKTARLWEVPRPNVAPDSRLSVVVNTGMEIGNDDDIFHLKPSEWRQYHRLLQSQDTLFGP
jgi:WD40 repeat protein